MPPNPDLLDLLARQDGLISVEQAGRVGLPARTLRRQVRDGGWLRVAPRVMLAGGHAYTPRARVRTAALWAGDRAVVSGPAAAWWLGMLPTAPRTVEVTVPRTMGLRPQLGISVRRRDLDVADAVCRAGIRLTDTPLTTLETAISMPEGSAFLDRALQKHVRFDRLYRCYCRTLGAHGSATMSRLLSAAADRADSAAERMMISLLRRAGIVGWEHGRAFERWTIDFAFAGARVAVEVDGWAWHMDVDRFRADRHKGNALVRARWDLLRFTWHDLTNRPDYVVAEVLAALRANARTA